MSRFLSRASSTAIVIGLATVVLFLSMGTGYGFNDKFGPLGPAVDVKERHVKKMMADPDVVGAGVGMTADGKPSIKVLTKKSGVKGIPETLEGFPVEVEVTGEIFALPSNGREFFFEPQAKGKPGSQFDTKARITRPVPIGVSTGNAGECSAGTIGARVKNSKGDVFALSNNHVYALENEAAIGSAVLQPGRYDTQCSYTSNNVIGYLSDFEDIVMDNFTPNVIDAAIASTSTDNVGKSTPDNVYGAPSTTTVGATSNLPVKKFGRTTLLTHGKVYTIATTIRVGYSTGTAVFEDQIGVIANRGAFIGAGDSGSLLVTETGDNPVGLLFAGNGSGKYAYANPISPVLSRFGVTIDGK